MELATGKNKYSPLSPYDLTTPNHKPLTRLAISQPVTKSYRERLCDYFGNIVGQKMGHIVEKDRKMTVGENVIKLYI